MIMNVQLESRNGKQRHLTPNRWNYVKEVDMWVFLEIDEKGEEYYYFQRHAPRQFKIITDKIRILNEKMLLTEDEDENDRLFGQIMALGDKLQCMGRETDDLLY